ncbi:MULTISPECIES: hypothetical protein [Sphingobacterium]|uniref:hypothetical protein n=1 Tax=Sphingobacterium TaxID=28453 RepID=UPI000ED50A93|nr:MULTISPECIES: hypothetical protein [Sphingobacterium]HAF34673.1 hypothetical protein [Sphingobacterium sp.]
MRTQKNKENENFASELVKHSIIIEGGTKKYDVNLIELSSFLDNIDELGISDIRDLIIELEVVADYAIDGAPDNAPMSQVKRPLKVMREIIFLMQNMLEEEKK